MKKTGKGNIFCGIPEEIPEEVFETISGGAAVKIERIISRGQATPAGKWYDQDLNEWVILLQGSAEIAFEDTDEIIALEPGDYVNIAAHCRHRVNRTDDVGPTVWLAIHYR